MNAVCCKCKKMIDRQRESRIAIPGKKRKSVCMECHVEWESLKDRVWHEFLNPPDRRPRWMRG